MNQQLQYTNPQPLPWWCQLVPQLLIMAAVDVLVTLLLHAIPAV